MESKALNNKKTNKEETDNNKKTTEIVNLDRHILIEEESRFLDVTNLLVFRDLFCDQHDLIIHISIASNPYVPYYCFTKDRLLDILHNCALIAKDTYDIYLKQ